MTKAARKQNKAVEKIRNAIRKAVEKGVSQALLKKTVEQAIAKASDTDPVGSGPAIQASPKVRKIPGARKTGDVTLKRGVVDRSGKPLLKKYPGKTTPSTPTLKREKNS